MTNTTAVPSPTFGDQGFVAPPESAILAGAQADLNTVFGTSLNQGLYTPQGQWASTETAIIGDSNAVFLWFCSQVDPAFSSGRMQDAIARIYFISRIPGAPTVQPCICIGLQNTVIPVGALAKDQLGNFWVSQEQVTIPVDGSVTVNFAFSSNGPNPGPETLIIAQAVFGWDSITPLGDAALGIDVETREAFELRRAQSTAINATGHLPSILGAVLNVDNVLDAFVTENVEATPQSVGGVSLNPNSLYVCALGGDPQDVAGAIWSRKAPGCAYTGNISRTVVDPSPQYIPPVPSYLVTYQTPDIITFAVRVVLDNNTGIPADALTQIQSVIINAFAGTDGGSRAKIGSLVLASRYYNGVLSLGPWAELVQITIGRSGFVGGTAASVTGSISGTTLTVTATTNAVITGGLLQGTALSVGSFSGSATAIVGQISGAVNGTGTYTLNRNLGTIASSTYTLTELGNSVQMDIDEAPTVTAGTIYLNLI